ncbi:MAG TPA: hypothetical protein VHM24_01435 [Gemmatimonadaceae bacterium]|nr:hypothetical protein [Gemmatimonadaceae bacterium]
MGHSSAPVFLLALTDDARSGTAAGDATSAATIREATLEDAVEVSALLSRLGLQFPSDPLEIERYWKWLWAENPALDDPSRRPPVGWILEYQGSAVGFFGNIAMRYRFGDETLLAAVASSWGVERRFRSHTGELAKHYFGQDAADILLATTASRSVGRIFSRGGAVPMPLPDYRDVLYWVLEPRGFLRAALRRTGLPSALAIPAVLAGAPAVKLFLRLQGGLPHARRHQTAEVIPLDTVGAEFDDLWSRKSSDGRLYAYRNARELRWHLKLHEERGKLTLFASRRGGLLAGYLVLVREETPGIGLTRAKIVDLFVADDDPAIIEELMSAAANEARVRHCHVLEAVGFPAMIRTQLRKLKPFTRRFPDFPMHFKARAPAVHAALQRTVSWYPTLYDGDSSLY